MMEIRSSWASATMTLPSLSSLTELTPENSSSGTSKTASGGCSVKVGVACAGIAVGEIQVRRSWHTTAMDSVGADLGRVRKKIQLMTVPSLAKETPGQGSAISPWSHSVKRVLHLGSAGNHHVHPTPEGSLARTYGMVAGQS
jgi:hypothetical protein